MEDGCAYFAPKTATSTFKSGINGLSMSNSDHRHVLLHRQNKVSFKCIYKNSIRASGSLRQNQFDKLTNSIPGNWKGIYSKGLTTKFILPSLTCSVLRLLRMWVWVCMCAVHLTNKAHVLNTVYSNFFSKDIDRQKHKALLWRLFEIDLASQGSLR